MVNAERFDDTRSCTADESLGLTDFSPSGDGNESEIAYDPPPPPPIGNIFMVRGSRSADDGRGA